MTNRHRSTLHALFAHPISANIDPRQVFAAIEAVGGEVSHSGHGHVVIKLNGHTHGFHNVGHAFAKDDVVVLRKFLTQAGIDPANDAMARTGAA